MKNLILAFLCIASIQAFGQEFEIRGVLPWHNFLSGPTAWNVEDYENYLDECKERKINLIAFHNYTGGNERYFNYVEPMVKIQYKNVLPETTFDHSGTTRWGYLPMKVKDFAFATNELFDLPEGAEYFGADCAITTSTNEERYDKAQELMKKVLEMAHERGIQMAMGFEFGIYPPEFASIGKNNEMYWTGQGGLAYNPFDPNVIGILYATIDDILESYQGIDWITLWLNEHCMYGVAFEKAMEDPGFREYYDKNVKYYEGEGVDDMMKFIGVWSQAFLEKAYDYIKLKSPDTGIQISGWGGQVQLPRLLTGLNKSLPTDIVFSMLYGGQGMQEAPTALKEISKDRKVWGIPWLEGDASLLHLQFRADKLRNDVVGAHEDGLDGVLAIHWRTEEVMHNWDVFAHYASHPDDEAETAELYDAYCRNELGDHAAKHLSPVFLDLDVNNKFHGLISPDYYPYWPEWGRLNEEQMDICQKVLIIIADCMAHEKDRAKLSNLRWYQANFEFTILLHEVGIAMEPAWALRTAWLLDPKDDSLTPSGIEKALKALRSAPLEKMFEVYTSRIRSRGELGELSEINQRIWGEYQGLESFLNELNNK